MSTGLERLAMIWVMLMIYSMAHKNKCTKIMMIFAEKKSLENIREN